MRVLIITNMYPTPSAPWLGAFVQQQELSLRKLGVGVEVAAHIGRGARWNYLHALPALARRLRIAPFDLLHSHHTYSTVLALAARRLSGRRVPLVATFHEGEVFSRGAVAGTGVAGRLRHSLWLKAWALRRVDFAIPVQRDMLRAVLGEAGAARLPSRVIPAGIDLAQFQPEPAATVRARLGWDPAQPVIFFPSDPAKPGKGYDLARAGFELFAQGCPGARLVVGGGIPYDRMPDTIKASDVILNPTDFEASPTIIKEALACERPVVSTDAGDVREAYGGLPGVLICDRTAGDVAAKLEQAVAVKIPFGGHQRIVDLGLDLDQVARRLLAVYEEVRNRNF